VLWQVAHWALVVEVNGWWIVAGPLAPTV